ncbi:hypothetical protein [Actinoplanes sp. CA-252034]|uniref:hypothetical protein n=1 Tax=Actinoplanes sp. CA-252034 TaxID=3239906 RepID=UPI003D998BE2
MTAPRRLAALLTLIVGVAVLSGCGRPDADSPAPAGPPAPAGSPAPGGDPAAAANGSYAAKDVCDYLESEIPALKEIGSPVGRHANLAGKLATFFESHGKPENGAVLDEATRAECPDVRSEVLDLIGVESFSAF